LAQHYDRPPEEYWLSDYFSDTDEQFHAQADRFRSLWTGTGKPRALDVGAGIGKTMDTLEHDGFDVYGLEPSPTFVKRAISRGIPAERVKIASVEEAEYGSDAFDLVNFSAVLEHLHDPGAAIERALGWLSPGGLICVDVPSARWLLARLVNMAYRAQGLDYVMNLSPMHPPYHLYEFTIESFERHARQTGYSVVGHQTFVCQTYLPPPLDTLARRVMKVTQTGMQLQVWLMRAGPPR
jgi:SAM-dependent methyltransferase